MDSSTPGLGCGRLRGVLAATAVAVLGFGAVPASAQIISTSIPRADTAGAQAAEKKFALHIMGSPFSKWRYNELVAGVWEDDFGDPYADIGFFTGDPNSDFILAGEGVFKVSSNWTVGFGGWYNKVGKVEYDFDVDTYDLITGDKVDDVTGTLQGDLKLSEGHGSVFYKDIGVQFGVVRTSSKLSASRIATSSIPSNVGQPLGSIEVDEDSSATDWDLYGVYKYAGATTGQTPRAYGLSAGAGIYAKSGSTESSQRSAEDQKVFSGFVTGTFEVYKGFGVDVSYWYIAKTEADFGTEQPVTSKNASNRFTIGFSYTFSR
jgi:hypothetical protein